MLLNQLYYGERIYKGYNISKQRQRINGMWPEKGISRGKMGVLLDFQDLPISYRILTIPSVAEVYDLATPDVT